MIGGRKGGKNTLILLLPINTTLSLLSQTQFLTKSAALTVRISSVLSPCPDLCLSTFTHMKPLKTIMSNITHVLRICAFKQTSAYSLTDIIRGLQYPLHSESQNLSLPLHSFSLKFATSLVLFSPHNKCWNL